MLIDAALAIACCVCVCDLVSFMLHLPGEGNLPYYTRFTHQVQFTTVAMLLHNFGGL